MITLPEQPWQKDDTFTVEETGLVYTFDGEKWLAANGEEFDGDLYATKAQLDALAEESALTDNSLFKAIEEESTKTNVAVTALQIELNNVDKKSQSTDRDLQKQIDDIDEKIDAIDVPDGVDLGPVEDRLDDIEAVLPKAPIVIPPVEIGSGKVLIDHPTRPSGADKPPAEEMWMWHMDADRTGNPANEMKTTVTSEYQGNVILDGITAVWFKQGERVQKWNTSNGGWWTGGNLWHLSASSTEGDTLVDGQPFEIYYIDPNTTGDSFVDAISRAESKADDRRLQADLEEIALILSTLSNSIENGFYEYVGNSVPTQPGQFSLAFPDVTTAENIITFNEVDADGTTHNLPATVSVDDYLEIVDQEHPEQFGLWQVTAVPDGTGIFSVQAKLVKAGETFDGNDRCEVRFFSTTDALDVNELDARYLRLTGGTLTGTLNFGRDHRVLARINPAGGTTQEIDLFEGNSGGQILKFDVQGATWKNAIVFQSGGSNNKQDILRIDSNNKVTIRNLGLDDTRINDVADPTEDKDAANKQYVDSTVKAEVDGNFVSKTGGDEMQGPFKITNNPDLNTRDARKLEVLDVKSGSDNSSLNLGAKNTSIYVGENQTTFIKPVLMLELGGKDGNPVKLLNEGTEDNHLVSKGYVDGAVQSGIEGIELPGTDLSGLATEEWVNGQIDAIPDPDLSGLMPLDGNSTKTGRLVVKTNDGTPFEIQSGNGTPIFKMWASGAVAMEKAYSDFKDNELVTKKYVDDKVQSSGGGSLVSTSVACKWKANSSTDSYTFFTQNSNGSASDTHGSTKYLNIRVPNNFWTVKAGVVPAGRDMGYVTVIDPANGQIVFSGMAITVSSGGTTFKIDVYRELWTNSPTYWAADKMYLIRMESCFREA